MRYGSVQNAEIHFFCSENRIFYMKKKVKSPFKGGFFVTTAKKVK